MFKVRFAVILSLAIVIATTAVHLTQLPNQPITNHPPRPTTHYPQSTQLQQSFGQLPLLFVENQGQWDQQVAYAVQGSDKTLYFTPEGVTFALTAPVEEEEVEEDGRPQFDQRHLSNKPTRSQRYTVKLDFLGANPNVQPIGQEQDSAVISYFKGQPDDWHTGLSTYRRLIYPNLWPGIDLIYEGTVNRLKYHFLVHPGADPNQIRLAYRGATSVTLNDAGQLVVQTPLGSFEDDTPVAYQEIDGERVSVDMAYTLVTGKEAFHSYRFEIGEYDLAQPLILDPVVFIYSGYIGGDGLDESWGIDVDDGGNVYITGTTESDETTFPIGIGPDLTFNGNSDVFILKLNSQGTELVYAGYIGGTEFDLGTNIKVDGTGAAYITGGTSSTEGTFPVTIGPDLTFNGIYDAFVAKVNPTGTSLDFAGYIGGDEDEEGTELAIDDAGNVYVIGWTESTESTFPVLVGPDLTYNGGVYGDGFITKVMADGTGLYYSGYIGGSELDAAYGIAVDSNGNAHVSGFTESSEASFPVLVGPDLTFNGVVDAFVTKVNSAGTDLIYSGYIGGINSDIGCRLVIDDVGNTYITGTTDSDENSFPLINGPDLTFNGLSDVFVTKINSNGVDLIYSGYIGGSFSDYGCPIEIDDTGSIYITGITDSDQSTFPVTQGPDLTYNGGFYDSFAVKISPSGTDLVYAGYIGGTGSEYGYDIAIDGEGNAYVVGRTSSNEQSFPVIVGPDLTYNGSEDGFVTKIGSPIPPLGIGITGPITGTTGMPYVFTATTFPLTTTQPLTYTWFATGLPSITQTNGLTDTAVFTWNITGPQLITVTASNAFGTVTATHTILLNEAVSADFTATPTTGSVPLPVTFTNLSTGDYDTCLWNFGDNEVYVIFGTGSDCNLIHQYTSPGIYTVILTVTGPGGTDTITKTNYITVDPAIYLPVMLKP